ncbi:MAG: glycosyltransferase family 1 protein [Pseudoalteromonas sp.]|nr:glycosyltransferase family 1 protein [Pseudoalteromonas sp.]
MYLHHRHHLPDILDNPSPNGQEIVSYGAACSEPKPLPAELESFVSDPKSKGTILVAFGTVVDWAHAPRRIMSAVTGTLEKLSDYRIIWGFKSQENRPAVSSHIRLMKWMPQNDLLFHRKTVLLFNHGGLKRCGKLAYCFA